MQNTRQNCRFFIGIDCGVNTGLAIWDRKQKKLVHLESTNILNAMKIISGFVEFHNTDENFSLFHFRVEDARQRKWIPRQANEKAERGRNRGAGSVMRDAQIWQDFFEMNGYGFEMVAPKNNKTKVKAGYFKLLTKWEKPTNEHTRDAAMLVVEY